jgi:hypothetical protein
MGKRLEGGNRIDVRIVDQHLNRSGEVNQRHCA